MKPLTLKLKSGVRLAIREGTPEDRIQVYNLGIELYLMFDLIKSGPMEEGDFIRIASLPDIQDIKIGFHRSGTYSEGERTIGEVRWAYVIPQLRGQAYGSVLIAQAALELIDNEAVSFLRFRPANPGVRRKLDRLGFRTTRPKNGNPVCDIDLNNRDTVRETWNQYLERFLES